MIFLILAASAERSFALKDPEKELASATLTPRLGEKIDLSLPFTDSFGVTKPLSDFAIPNRPFLLVPAYYDCPRLCGLVFGGMATLLNGIDLSLGDDFSVMTVSFDPRDTPQRAETVLNDQRTRLDRPSGAQRGLHVLVGSEESSRTLMNQLGYGYLRDGEEYAHPAAFAVITPQGQIVQYFTGINFEPKDVRLALVDGSAGKIGSPLDYILLYCFRFDHTTGQYTLAVFNTLRVVGVVSIVLLGGLIIFLRRRERALKG